MIPLLTLALAVCLAGMPSARAQDEDPVQSGAAADSLAAAGDTTAVDTTGMSRLEALQAQAAARKAQAEDTEAPEEDLPLFVSLTNAPKAGALANVRSYTYYGDLVTTLKFRHNSVFTNNFGWSWEEYRKQDKTVQKRDNTFTFGLSSKLPAAISLDGAWNWSEDNTVNTAGLANLSKRDIKRISVKASKTNFETGLLTNIAKVSAGVTDQANINQNKRNDLQEGKLDGGFQTALDITEGVSIAGRIYGMATSGDRALGESTSPSSANGDTLGFGVYYKRAVLSGQASVTRSNFEKKYLDFRKNSNGLIDTVEIDESKKVVTELETVDALSYQLDNNFDLGPLDFNTRLTRVTDDLNYAQSGVGLKQREQDVLDLTLTYGAGRDSFSVSYDYLLKWDDQRYKNATANRGRQYNKARDYEFNYYRDLFRATTLNLRYHEGLGQDIAENRHNENDKDRHQSDFSARMDRNWFNKFRATLVFAYQQTQDFNISESRSSNNNVKDSYEVSPGYDWTIAPWLNLDQSYRVYIQYTNYSFSGMEGVTRQDDYNKRGNLATRVTIDPTSRLNITLRHDFNKRFAATKSVTDAAGNSYYRRDLNQTISKIELYLKFTAAPGVTLEASTYRTRDDRETFGIIDKTTRNLSGEMWVGARVSEKWFATNPLELSAMVRKYNAFGPSVTETSSDYWEADVWLKWEF